MLPSAKYNIIGRPQKVADYDITRGVRISGSGLADFRCQCGTGPIGNNIPGFFLRTATDPLGALYPWVPMTPTNVDRRLQQICETYQFYAFRKLTMHYIPSCGTIREGNLALCVSQDSEIGYSLPSPSQANILQVNTSQMMPVWTPASLTYSHNGAKTWDTTTNGSEPGQVKDFYQGAFGISYDNVYGGGPSSGVTGNIYFTYVIDLYQPQPGIIGTGLLNAFPCSGRFVSACEEKELEQKIEDIIDHHHHGHHSRRSSHDRDLPHPLPLLSCRTEFPPLPDALMPVSPDLRSAAPHD